MYEFFDKILDSTHINHFITFVSEIIGFKSPWDIVKAIVDIGLVTFFVYKSILMLKETRAWQLVKGVLFIIVAAKISDYAGLSTTAFILNHTVQYIAIALVVLFQPELRRALEQIGRSRFKSLFNFEEENNILKTTAMIEEVVRAVNEMARSGVGALIIIERQTKIGEIISSGVHMDSKISHELVTNIFSPNTPLHDGAMIIRGSRIKAVGCFLPLTDNKDLSKGIGTRHRAALGVSEISDSIAIIVSEETSTISVALDGGLIRNLTSDTLRKSLHKNLLTQKQKGFNKKLALWKVRAND